MPPAAYFSQQLEKWAKEPFETEGFKTSFPVCKRYILTPADTGNWRISTIAAATWAVEETFSSTVGKGLPSGRRIIPFTGAGAAAGLLQSQFPLRPITNKALEGKENPKTIGFKRKSPNRRLWRMKRGGFEEVSRFSRHNVAGNRLTRR